MPETVLHSVSAKEEALLQARRYLAGAEQLLSQTPVIEQIVYANTGNTREAAASACLAALKAIDGYLLQRGVQTLPRTISDYQIAVETLPLRHKIQPRLTVVYQNLHVLAYLGQGVDVWMIRSGIKRVKEIIELIAAAS